MKATGKMAMPGTARAILQGSVGTAWLSACLLGAYLAMSYDFQPGRLGPRQPGWPMATGPHSSAAPALSPAKTTVLAFLHPRCVCTRATVKHLVNAMQAHPEADLMVSLFVPLQGADHAGWRESDHLTAIQSAVPGAQIVWDRGGAQARTFGALTSGTILVYDAQAREVFRGGITDRRGGEGANAGLDRLTRVLSGEPAGAADPSPVFGCSLVAPMETVGQGGT